MPFSFNPPQLLDKPVDFAAEIEKHLSQAHPDLDDDAGLEVMPDYGPDERILPQVIPLKGDTSSEWIRLLSKIQRKRGGFRDRVKLARNTWAIVTGTGDDRVVSVRLHNTDIIKYASDNSCLLDSGGWLTVLTRDRINNYLPGSWGVHTVKGTWYWHNRNWSANNPDARWGEPYPGFLQEFSSGDRIGSDGVLYPSIPPMYVPRRARKERPSLLSDLGDPSRYTPWAR